MIAHLMMQVGGEEGGPISRLAARADALFGLRPRRCASWSRDKGQGIPADRLEDVFEPFYRLEPSRSRKTGGVGLGLSIARDIARPHGGNLVLGNREGGGLEAVRTLPRTGRSG